MGLSVPYGQEYKIDFYYRRILIQRGRTELQGTVVVGCSHVVTYSPTANSKPNFVSSPSAVEISLTLPFLPGIMVIFSFKREDAKLSVVNSRFSGIRRLVNVFAKCS